MTVTARPAANARWKSTLAAVAIAAVAAFAANSVIALVARGLLDVPSQFQQLTPAVYGPLTVLGTLFGAIGWRLIVAKARNAAALLRWLVPTVLILSLIPDLLVGLSNSMPGTTTTGVGALMLMHVAVVAIAVPVYRRFMPPQS